MNFSDPAFIDQQLDEQNQATPGPWCSSTYDLYAHDLYAHVNAHDPLHTDHSLCGPHVCNTGRDSWDGAVNNADAIAAAHNGYSIALQALKAVLEICCDHEAWYADADHTESYAHGFSKGRYSTAIAIRTAIMNISKISLAHE